MNLKSIFLYQLLNKIDLKFDKKFVKNVKIVNIADLLNSKKNYLSFFNNIKYLQNLKDTKAVAVFVPSNLAEYVPKKIISIITEKPEFNFYKVINLFYDDSYFSKFKYKKLSIKEIKTKFNNIKFGINFYLDRSVKIINKAYIGNNVTIKNNSIVGNNVTIGSNVVIENAIIHDNVHICDGSIIGKKGFGFKFIDNKCFRIPHVGKVVIYNGCEIGSNCTIDRGSVTDTIIDENTFIDNLVHIAHNVKIGKRCIIAGQVGIAGSTKIGDFVTIGGQSGISGHLNIGNNVKIGGKSGVIKNIKDNEIVMGYPAKSIREFLKNK